jgi:hypothetical protein
MIALLTYVAGPLGLALGVAFGIKPIMNLAVFILPISGLFIILACVACMDDEDKLKQLSKNIGTGKNRERIILVGTLATVTILAAVGWYVTAAIWLLQLGAIVSYVEKARKYKKGEENEV